MKAAPQISRLRLVSPKDQSLAPTSPEAPRNDSLVPSSPTSSTRSQSGRVLAGALSALSDENLVALGLRGNVSALEVLYRRHSAFAIHLAVRIAGTACDAEDVVHDAFLQAFVKLRELSDGALFRAWLGAIVVHAVRSRLRRVRLMRLLGLGSTGDPVDLDAIASPAASPVVRAQIAQVYALLQTLPADERIAWTLRAVEGHELETVAELTRCSLATVKRRISRAQDYLDRHFVEPTADEVAP